MSLSNVTKLKRKAAELEQKKQFDKALALYIQVLDDAGRDLDDADLQLYNRVGDLLLRAGNVSESLAYYEKAVDMYAERGFLNNAIALCNKILRQSPARTAVYYKLGKISANKGFKSDAKKNFLEYADRMQKSGNIEEAFRSLKEFTDLCPDQDDIRLMLADLLNKENRGGEALKQLEALYHKLDAEGRDAEARATLDRMKAIDPHVTPRPSGSFETVKQNDLIFLDLGEVAARSRTPRQATPIAPPAVVTAEAPPTAIPALEGLTLTFIPTDEPEHAEVPVEATVEGLTATVDVDDVTASDLQDVHPLEGLDVQDVAEESTSHVDPTHVSIVGESDGVDDDATAAILDLEPTEIVLPAEESLVEDVAREVLPLELVPVEAQDAGDEPYAPVEQEIEETPDEWVSAALNAPVDNAAFDLLLGGSSPADGAPVVPNEVIADAVIVLPEELPAVPSSESDWLDDAADDEGEVEAEFSAAAPELDDDAVAAAREEAEFVEQARIDAVQAAAELTGPADVAEANDVVELGLEELIARANADAATPMLDLDGLQELAARVSSDRASEEGLPLIDEDALLRSAFAETASELPLLDVGEVSEEDRAAEGLHLDALLSSTPSFGDAVPADPDFAPEPILNDTHGEWPSSDAPEVLIDGEWRDEHVGKFVSGEMYAIPAALRDREQERPIFDDLAAAMLQSEEPEAAPRGRMTDRIPTPASPEAFTVRLHTPRSTLSLGGAAGQLRQRLELDPTNWGLRRMLGEALLDEGDREGGLNALDQAMRGFEAANDLKSARTVVDVILSVVPLSVRHHQKRVEYAVRTNDRVQLVEAYAELADALFRCGEVDKSRAVYARVLELAPTFDRARFALQILPSQEPPRHLRQTPTGISAGTPSVDLATLAQEDAADDVAVSQTLEQEIDTAFQLGSSAPEPQEPPSAPAANAGFVDLSGWLEDVAPTRSTRMVADDVTPTGDEDADFEELLRRFKQGLAQNVEEEDFASHYDLGVAFKEMGLVDEAIAAFQKALRGEGYRVRAYEALGQCFSDKGQHHVVASLLERAVATLPAADDELVGVLYLLAYSLEVLARLDEAERYYQRIFAVDIEFRDVPARLAAIERQKQ